MVRTAREAYSLIGFETSNSANLLFHDGFLADSSSGETLRGESEVLVPLRYLVETDTYRCLSEGDAFSCLMAE